MNNKRNRASLLGVAAGYLVYLAVDLFLSRNQPESSMPVPLIIVVSFFFIISAGCILLYAKKIWKRTDEKDIQEQ